MKNVVTAAALPLALLLLPACAAQAPGPDAAPAPDEDVREVGTPEEPHVHTGAAGGAVTVLESEEESGGHFTNMADMLRGRVAGLQVIQRPNGDISLRIRGLRKSFVGNEEPLLVVDGIPMPTYSISNTLRTMNPSDVESVRVLKDVGSTSAYGVRGANGVIVIRLKRR